MLYMRGERAVDLFGLVPCANKDVATQHRVRRITAAASDCTSVCVPEECDDPDDTVNLSDVAHDG